VIETEEAKANNEEPEAQETTANAAEEAGEGDKQASEAVVDAEGKPQEQMKGRKPTGEGRGGRNMDFRN
jgi:hypothetical protein